MADLRNRHIIIGITGGIAAYKTVELVRRLKEAGALVRVVMTQGAQAFVTPLTFQGVSGFPVHYDLFDAQAEAAMGHIELARWAELILIAPATANTMAHLAHGIAKDLLTNLCLATEAPLWVAPAMNQRMWLHPATQCNVNVLKERGVRILGPGEGVQACGDVGPGRMLEPEELLFSMKEFFSNTETPKGSMDFSSTLLKGLRVLITAGPTIESLDPVRYFSNHSSGKMGYALAEAALRAGAEVTLVSGPTALTPPPVHHYISVESALHMKEAVLGCLSRQDIYIGAAAIADYRPETMAFQKLPKSKKPLTIKFIPNPDIIAEVAKQTPRPYVVGFSAQTEDLERRAQEKLKQKNLDMIAANEVGLEKGFQVDENALTVYWREGDTLLSTHFPKTHKRILAQQLIECIGKNYQDSLSQPKGRKNEKESGN